MRSSKIGFTQRQKARTSVAACLGLIATLPAALHLSKSGEIAHLRDPGKVIANSGGTPGLYRPRAAVILLQRFFFGYDGLLLLLTAVYTFARSKPSLSQIGVQP